MIRKHKSGAYKITLPIYECGFHLATSLEVVEKLTGKTHNRDAMGFVQEFEGEPPVMVLLDRSPNTIAHECAHVALILMEKLGMRALYAEPEPFAYIMGWITEQVYEVLDRDS